MKVVLFTISGQSSGLQLLLARAVVLDAQHGALARVVHEQRLFLVAAQHLVQIGRDLLLRPLGAALEQLFEAQSGGKVSYCLIW